MPSNLTPAAAARLEPLNYRELDALADWCRAQEAGAASAPEQTRYIARQVARLLAYTHLAPIKVKP